MSNYLSKRGYVVRKEKYSSEELSKLKLELRARPLVDDKFAKQGDLSYPVYMETKNKLYIPKMFGINKFGFPATVLENFEGKEWDTEHEFVGSLLERQHAPVDSVLNACYTKGGGILSASTGTGKSIMGLYALSKLKSKAIIVVNKIPLMNQWKSEIQKFLPTVKVGTLQGQKNIDIEDCDIVVAMLQSMARIDYPDELFSDFRTLIFDEVHNSPSQHFSKVLFKLCCKYTIGLSATPKRADGCEYVFKWHLGDIVYETNVERKGLPPIIRTLKIDTTEYKEVATENKFTGQKQIQFTSMLSDLVEMPKRNKLIIELIKDYVKNDNNRKILVLSDRRTHILNIKKLLEEDLSITFTYGLFLGGMKIKDLDKGRSCQIILATFAAFKEGVSEKDLDTLILCTPKKYVGNNKNSVKNEGGGLEQICGRIFRKDHIERNPIIVDLYDQFSVYKSQGNSRKVFYKEHFKNGLFEEQSINLDDNDDVNISFIKNKKKSKKQELEDNKEVNLDKMMKYCMLDD
jgi:hypothetical protein